MTALLEQQDTLRAETAQEDETLPECLREYQPFVLLWSEKEQQPAPSADWKFSEDCDGMGLLDIRCSQTKHDVYHTTGDGAGGTVIIDCTYSV